MNNILITSVGKRVSLVKIFKTELKQKFPSSKIYATELNPSLSPAAYICDECFRLPRVTDSSYIDKLLQICLENNVKLIIPTIDTELEILSQNKSRFEKIGTTIAVSSTDFIQQCRDKRKTIELFDKLSIAYPQPRDKYNPVFPMFAKPYDGSLSANLHVINNSTDLTPEILNDEKLIFMELVDKSEYKEFTVDLYYGKDNHIKSIVPRERISVRAGEINKGITRKSFLVDFLKEKLEYIPGVIGCICIQLFVNESTQKVLAIEINPRFGGGYPLSYHSGANYPQYLIEEYIVNKSISYNCDWQDNTLMLRYDDDIIIHNYK